MKVLETLKSVPPLELALFVIFVLYIVFYIDTPKFIASFIDSPLGMVVLLCVAIYLFLYTNPILGVLFIFVAFELLRRSSNVTARQAIQIHTPTQSKIDSEMKAMNPPEEKTLEEESIDIRAPIGASPVAQFVDSSFKPIADKISAGVSLL